MACKDSVHGFYVQLKGFLFKGSNFVFLKVQFVSYLLKKLMKEVWLVRWEFKRLGRYFKLNFIGHKC